MVLFSVSDYLLQQTNVHKTDQFIYKCSDRSEWMIWVANVLH